jgi:hypothetical protein
MAEFSRKKLQDILFSLQTSIKTLTIVSFLARNTWSTFRNKILSNTVARRCIIFCKLANSFLWRFFICAENEYFRRFWKEISHVSVEVTLQLTVSQCVLVSSTLLGCYFLSECSCPKFAVLSLLLTTKKCFDW